MSQGKDENKKKFKNLKIRSACIFYNHLKIKIRRKQSILRIQTTVSVYSVFMVPASQQEILNTYAPYTLDKMSSKFLQ